MFPLPDRIPTGHWLCRSGDRACGTKCSDPPMGEGTIVGGDWRSMIWRETAVHSPLNDCTYLLQLDYPWDLPPCRLLRAVAATAAVGPRPRHPCACAEQRRTQHSPAHAGSPPGRRRHLGGIRGAAGARRDRGRGHAERDRGAGGGGRRKCLADSLLHCHIQWIAPLVSTPVKIQIGSDHPQGGGLSCFTV